MSSTFGSDPPCYAKPVVGTRPSDPPSYSNSANASASSSSIDEQQRLAIEKEIAEANLAAEAARMAAAEEARMEREAQQLKAAHDEQLSNLRVMVGSKAQFRIRQMFDEAKIELRKDLMNQKLLEVGKERIEQLLKEGEERKALLTRENASLDEAIVSLESWIEAVEEHIKNEEEAAPTDIAQKVDLLAIPTDTYSAQMLELSAETAAIDDTIYFLDRALVRGNITLDVFLKEVRKLSKRQFMAKVSFRIVLCE
jgi:ESCRT-I complex subunit TSG101